MNTYIIDIETIPSVEPPPMHTISADARLKDPEKIALDKAAKLAKAWDQTSLDPVFGQVFCVGVSYNMMEPAVLQSVPGRTSEENEREVLISLGKVIQRPARIMAWTDSSGFDWNFLIKRAAKHGLFDLCREIRRAELVPLGKLWQMGDLRCTWNKDDVARLLGIDNPDPVSGKDVADLYRMGQWDSIHQHAYHDVVVETKIAQAMANMGLLHLE